MTKNRVFRGTVTIALLALLLLSARPQETVRAETENEAAGKAELLLPGGASSSRLTDHSHYTNMEFPEGSVLTVKNAAGVRGLYIEWDPGISAVNSKASDRTHLTGKFGLKPWILEIGDTQVLCGETGYLHEYIPIEQPADELRILIPEGGASISGLYLLETETIPDFVQIWEEPLKQSDILLLSTHADDEIIFFGGTLPYYAKELGKKVQVAYFTYHTRKVRTHELLDGLWYCGIRNYPVFGEQKDIYSETLEHASGLYDTDRALGYVVELLRRFRPKVVLTHDLNGEYGHGVHMLCANLMTKAVELCTNPEKYPESVDKYGLWGVQKLYLHLYEKNRIDMEWDIPLASFDGLDGFEVAKLAIKKYDSQAGYYSSRQTRSEWSAYDCTRFGLYYSAVGEDVLKNDFLENTDMSGIFWRSLRPVFTQMQNRLRVPGHFYVY